MKLRIAIFVCLRGQDEIHSGPNGPGVSMHLPKCVTEGLFVSFVRSPRAVTSLDIFVAFLFPEEYLCQEREGGTKFGKYR